MKVIAAINGTMTAEFMAIYAIKYAEIQNFSLVILHIKNHKDEINDVEASAERISELCSARSIEAQFVVIDSTEKKPIKEFFEATGNIDTVFCSTRKKKTLISGSFSETLINMDIDADLAVVRIVKMSDMLDIDSMLLSIKEDKLSVKKFTFFSALASSYNADAEIYSVSDIFKWELSRLDIHKVREKLSVINFNLRHYIKLAYIMGFPLRIKHDFTENESQSILVHIAKSDAKLVVIGGKRLSVNSLFKKEMPIERLMRESSVNIIAFYTKED